MKKIGRVEARKIEMERLSERSKQLCQVQLKPSMESALCNQQLEGRWRWYAGKCFNNQLSGGGEMP